MYSRISLLAKIGSQQNKLELLYINLTNGTMMRYTPIITLLTLLSFSLPAQAQTTMELFLRGKELLDDGSNRKDIDQLLDARAIFEQILENDSLPTLAHYYAASVSSDIANTLADRKESGSKREIRAHINYSIDHLETAVEMDETFAEGWALLSTSYAQKITVNPLNAVSLRRKYNRAMSRAIELEPGNPRIILLKAIMDYNIPGILGGDKDHAIAELNRAASILLEEVVENPVMPSWGLDHAHARLGIAYMDQGELEKARSSFERALEINPDFGWVINELIPSLEELESKI